MSTQVIRLSTGEELIAQVETIDGKFYRLTDAAYLIPTQDNSLGLAPFMAYCDTSEGVDLDPKDVMFLVPPIKDLENQYDKMFGKSRIEMPEKKIII